MESTVKDSIHQKTSTVKDSIRQKRDRALPHGLVTSDHVAQGHGSPAAARVRDGAASCAPQTVSDTRCNADSGSTTLRFLSFTQGRNFGQDDKALRRGEGFNGIFVPATYIFPCFTRSKYCAWAISSVLCAAKSSSVNS